MIYIGLGNNEYPWETPSTNERWIFTLKNSTDTKEFLGQEMFQETTDADYGTMFHQVDISVKDRIVSVRFRDE